MGGDFGDHCGGVQKKKAEEKSGRKIGRKIHNLS